MYTLAHAHFAEYEDIPDPSDLLPSELPGGALILAMQAVSLALRVTSQDFAYFSFFRLNTLSNFGKPENLLRIKPPIFQRTTTVTLSKGRLVLMGG